MESFSEGVSVSGLIFELVEWRINGSHSINIRMEQLYDMEEVELIGDLD